MNDKPDSLANDFAKIKKYAPWVLVAVIAYVLFNVFSPKDTPTTEAETEPYTTFTFAVQCRDLVLEQLKTPKTASFEGTNTQQSQIRSDADGYVWAGVVDAQNSFAAQIRTRFKCTWDRASDQTSVQLLP